MARIEHPSTTDPERSPRLDRRRFLSRSALTSSALLAAPSALAATLSGCGASLPRTGRGESAELLDRLETGLGRIRAVPRGTIARELTWVARPDLSENILRQTLEALVVADVARSVPREGPVPAPLASRLLGELPLMARSTATHHALLARLPGSARRQLDARIETEPELPTDVADWIDRHARELGTATESRLQLRMAARDVKVRLRRQSANAVIDDCVAKVERAVARSGGSLAFARSSAATAMTEAIWQQLDGVPTPQGSGQALTVPQVLPPPGPPIAGALESEDLVWSRFMHESERFWSAHWQRPGDEERRIGQIMMPFGAISCGLLLIIGLIVLIAGLVQNSNWDGVPRVAD